MEKPIEQCPVLKTTDADFIRIMERLHKSLENGMRSAKTTSARRWLQERGLTYEATGACYNSGQIHHRRQQPFKDDLMKIGFLKISTAATNAGQIPYTAFGFMSVIFPLRNMDNQVINFYAIRVKNNKTAFLNDDGIYPKYPGNYTERLIIVYSALDAATVLQSGALKSGEAVMSLFDGQFKRQHYQAISALKELKEITAIDSESNPVIINSGL